MKLLAQRIESELRDGRWKHCAVYEDELQRFWPIDEQDREAKIAEFAKTYGLRLRFYQKGLCAIFDKWPRDEFTQSRDTGFRLRDLEPVKDVTGGGTSKGKSKRTAGRKGHPGPGARG